MDPIFRISVEKWARKIGSIKKSYKTFSDSLILAQSAQFYFLISHFNEKSKSVKMCKNIIYTFLRLEILNFFYFFVNLILNYNLIFNLKFRNLKQYFLKFLNGLVFLKILVKKLKHFWQNSNIWPISWPNE